MTVWKCPGCGYRAEGEFIDIGHRCPARKGAWTLFDKQPARRKKEG